MPKKFYSVDLKDGRTRRRVHDSVTGRIMGWEDVEDLDRPEGEFRIVEWTRYYEYRGDALHQMRNFEVRLRLPDGYDESEVEDMMDEIMDELIYNPSTREPTHGFFNRHMEKLGTDTIEFTEEESMRWKVIDNARPQFKYPKDRDWGEYGEYEE